MYKGAIWGKQIGNPGLNDLNGPLDEIHDAPRPITLRDLLRYTMGIGTTGYAGIAAEAFAALRGGGEITADEFMKRLGALPLADAPGERFMYGTPSRVTGVLISRVSGTRVQGRLLQNSKENSCEPPKKPAWPMRAVTS